jgi:hypothetical protein
MSPDKEVRRVSRSLYLAGPDDAIAVLAGDLGIRPERCLAWGGPNDWDWLANEESYLLDLFRADWPELEMKLAALSRQGLVLAVPDEESANPSEFILYENGEKRSVVVMDEDDETDNVRIVGSRRA